VNDSQEQANTSAQARVRLPQASRALPSGGTARGPNERLEQAIVLERQRALRALLQCPLLSADGPRTDEFGLVRRHAVWLRDWFSRNLDWTLQVDGETARLRKTPADVSDSTRPAYDARNGSPFTRRRYVILCLALACLERSDRQTTLGKLAEEIVAATRADPILATAGVSLELENFDHRRDLVQVMRLLMEYRVLVRVHGDEQQYLHEKGDVLYNVNRPALAGILNVKRGPSTISAESLEERIAAIVEEPIPDTEEARNRRIRTALMRRLLDDPVLYYGELTDGELSYLNRQRARLIREIEQATGLVAEVRREGIAMVDERGDLSDVGLPEEGTDGHVTLLLAEYLAGHARREEVAPVSMASLYRHVAELIARHRTHWRKSVLDPDAELILTDRTIDRLAALRLVLRTPDGIVPMPAIARYALREMDDNGTDRKKTDAPLLWEDDAA